MSLFKTLSTCLNFKSTFGAMNHLARYYRNNNIHQNGLYYQLGVNWYKNNVINPNVPKFTRHLTQNMAAIYKTGANASDIVKTSLIQTHGLIKIPNRDPGHSDIIIEEMNNDRYWYY